MSETHKSVPQIRIMSAPTSPMSPSSPTFTTRTHRRDQSHDTGFHEPLCGGMVPTSLRRASFVLRREADQELVAERNTTLPHPDADLSPNAYFPRDEQAVNQAVKRRSRSFIHRHRRTISHGSISNIAIMMQSASTLHSLPDDDEHHQRLSKGKSSVAPSLGISKVGTDSDLSRKDSFTPPSSPGATGVSPKRGLFRKWRRSIDASAL
jgi:hypothetical protein